MLLNFGNHRARDVVPVNTALQEQQNCKLSKISARSDADVIVDVYLAVLLAE
jgi:hypothetical protein